MEKLFLFIGLLSLVSCGSTKEGSTGGSDRFVVENLAEYNAEEIKKNYPDANIKEGSGMFEEGTVNRPFTVLYPDSEDELHITWSDGNRKKIKDIYFSGKGKWKSKEGINIGTTYDELTALNGKEISFYGFGWDYSGAVLWNDGKLEDTNIRVFLVPGNDEYEEKFIGDHLIAASPEEIEELDLRVQSIILQKN